MTFYKDKNHDSNIESYEIGPDFITVKFRRTSKLYTYSYFTAGRVHVEKMKILAKNGDGLNSYINLNCRDKYVK